MRKKVIIIIMVCSLFVSQTLYAKNDTNEYKEISNYVLSYMLGNQFDVGSVSSVKELFNSNDEIEALCITFEDKGYAIININSYSIEEFSIKAQSPYKGSVGVGYYDGPLSYYELVDDSFIGLKNDMKIEKSKKKNSKTYKKEAIKALDKEEKIIAGRQASQGIINLTTETSTYSTSFIEYGDLDHDLEDWTTIYACGLNATAIIVDYMDDWHLSSLVPYYNDGNPKLHQWLCTGGDWITMSDASAYDIVNGVNDAYGNWSGLDEFLEDRNADDDFKLTTSTSFSWTKMKDSISNDDLPVFLVCAPGGTWTQYHDVVVHGYHRGYDGVHYVSVNDVLGNNDVYIQPYQLVNNLFYVNEN